MWQCCWTPWRECNCINSSVCCSIRSSCAFACFSHFSLLLALATSTSAANVIDTKSQDCWSAESSYSTYFCVYKTENKNKALPRCNTAVNSAGCSKPEIYFLNLRTRSGMSRSGSLSRCGLSCLQINNCNDSQLLPQYEESLRWHIQAL